MLWELVKIVHGNLIEAQFNENDEWWMNESTSLHVC